MLLCVLYEQKHSEVKYLFAFFQSTCLASSDFQIEFEFGAIMFDLNS